jgi:hypothetical protein
MLMRLLLFLVALTTATAATSAPSRAQRLRAQEQRGTAALPGCTFTFGPRTDPDNAAAIVSEVLACAKSTPAVARELRFIRADSTGWTSHAQNAFAWGRTAPPLGIQFHEEKWDGDRSDARSITAHEWGHLLEFWALQHGQAARVRALMDKRSGGVLLRSYAAKNWRLYEEVFRDEAEFFADVHKAFRRSGRPPRDWYGAEWWAILVAAGANR